MKDTLHPEYPCGLPGTALSPYSSSTGNRPPYGYQARLTETGTEYVCPLDLCGRTTTCEAGPFEALFQMIVLAE